MGTSYPYTEYRVDTVFIIVHKDAIFCRILFLEGENVTVKMILCIYRYLYSLKPLWLHRYRDTMKNYKCYLIDSFIHSLLHHIHHDIWLWMTTFVVNVTMLTLQIACFARKLSERTHVDLRRIVIILFINYQFSNIAEALKRDQYIRNYFKFCHTVWKDLSFKFYLFKSRGRDRAVDGFTTTYAISAYHHWCCEFESRSGRDAQH